MLQESRSRGKGEDQHSTGSGWGSICRPKAKLAWVVRSRSWIDTMHPRSELQMKDQELDQGVEPKAFIRHPVLSLPIDAVAGQEQKPLLVVGKLSNYSLSHSFFLPHLYVDLSQSDTVTRCCRKHSKAGGAGSLIATHWNFICHNVYTHNHQASYLRADNISWNAVINKQKKIEYPRSKKWDHKTSPLSFIDTEDKKIN